MSRWSGTPPGSEDRRARRGGWRAAAGSRSLRQGGPRADPCSAGRPWRSSERRCRRSCGRCRRRRRAPAPPVGSTRRGPSRPHHLGHRLLLRLVECQRRGGQRYFELGIPLSSHSPQHRRHHPVLCSWVGCYASPGGRFAAPLTAAAVRVTWDINDTRPHASSNPSIDWRGADSGACSCGRPAATNVRSRTSRTRREACSCSTMSGFRRQGLRSPEEGLARVNAPRSLSSVNWPRSRESWTRR